MTRPIAWLLALLPAVAHAQIAPDSPMVRALREGRATAPLPGSRGARLVAQKIMEQTGSADEITVEFLRIARFEAQPRCGRVAFGPYQKSSNTFWGQFGGQVNICEDGTPPRRRCNGQAGLVPADTQCRDGSYPAETAEIKAAIAKAVADGSLTGGQFKATSEAQRTTRGNQE